MRGTSRVAATGMLPARGGVISSAVSRLRALPQAVNDRV